MTTREIQKTDDENAAREALEVMRRESAKQYGELRELMALSGWVHRKDGYWVHNVFDFPPQDTMHAAIMFCIQRGNEP